MVSDFCEKLRPSGRVLEDPDYNVWCCSPIYDEKGKVHVFYSRWLNGYGHLGWVAACEVAHAVADKPEGPYTTIGVAIRGSGGDNWDSWSIHNPTVHKVGDKYIMLFMGSSGAGLGITQEEIKKMTRKEYWPYFLKLVQSKHTGMAVADSLYGEWKRVENNPVVPQGAVGSWEDCMVSNPAFVITPEGKYRIYYKGMNVKEYLDFHGNRKYGFAESDNLEGPYVKYGGNPVIDFSSLGNNKQCEDAYVWYENNKYNLIMRDMGLYNHEYGLYMESADGIRWDNPQIGYREASYYFNEPLKGLEREGRFERPQLLMKDGHPEYLFCSYIGGKYDTSSGVVLKLM